jgi:hypothetical protein
MHEVIGFDALIESDEANHRWAAAGSDDTVLDVMVELEVGHGATKVLRLPG